MRYPRRLFLLLLLLEAGLSGSRSGAQTPRALWEKRVVKAPAVAPTLSGDTVWVAGTDRKIRSYNARSGARHWKRNLPASPVVRIIPTADRLFLGLGLPEPSIVALDRENGQEIWSKPLFRRPVGLALAGRNIVSATIQGDVEARSVEDGSGNWTREFEAIVSGIASTSRAIFVLARRDSLWCLSPDDGKTLWVVAVEGLHAAGPSIADSLLLRLSYDGELVLHDLGSGEVRGRAAVIGPQVAVPAIAEGRMVSVAAGGEMEVRFYPSLEKQWSRKRKETVSAPVTAWGNWWIVPTLKGHVFAFERSRGQTAWSLTFRESITMEAAANEEFLSLIDDKGRMVVYTLEGVR